MMMMIMMIVAQNHRKLLRPRLFKVQCLWHIFVKMDKPRSLLVYFRSCKHKFYSKKTKIFSGIRTRIIRIEVVPLPFDHNHHHPLALAQYLSIVVDSDHRGLKFESLFTFVNNFLPISNEFCWNNKNEWSIHPLNSMAGSI